MNKHQRELVSSLVTQVRDCAEGGSELEVRTWITRPMWRMWNLALGNHPDAPPTAWIPTPECNRVYGSETIVVESVELKSWSRRI